MRYSAVMKLRLLLSVFAAAFALIACTAAAAFASAPGLKQVRDPGRVTGTIHGHCSYRDKGQLPDPRCTPGSIDPIVTQSNIRSTICKGGWTDPHLRPPESQTETFKYNVAYPAYATPESEKTELDHLVPLELGGSNDATNLWPEYPPTPNPKDKVENALNAAVCDGRVSLAAAQQAIASDWMTSEKRLGIGPVVSGSSAPASTKPWCTASAAPANDGYSGDYNVSVKSNEPDRDATASDAGDTWSHDTNSSGATTIRLYYTSPGEAIRVTVGGASCSTTA